MANKTHPFNHFDFLTEEDFSLYNFAMEQVSKGIDVFFYADIENTGLALLPNGQTARIHFSGNRTAKQAENGVPNNETGDLF